MDSSTPSLRQQGMQALQEGNLDKAVDLLARSVMADDNDNDAKALLGIAYSQKGLHAQAKRALETAIQMAPNNANYRFNLGVVLARAGDLAGAAAAYRDTLAVNPQHAQARAKMQELGPQVHQLLANAPKLNVPPPGSGSAASSSQAAPAPVAPSAGAPPSMPSPAPGGMSASGAPPGMVQCEYCFKFSKLGMVCEHCSQPLPPPAKAAPSPSPAPPPPPMGAPAAYSPAGAAPVQAYARQQWGFDSGLGSGEAAGRRWAALFVDNLLMNGVGYAIGAAMGGAVGKATTPESAIGAAAASAGIGIGIQVAYMAGFTGITGQTLGKKLLGVRVVGPDGGPPGILRALLRETVGRFLSVIVCCLGYFWILWDKEQQAWHDKIAGTHVEKA